MPDWAAVIGDTDYRSQQRQGQWQRSNTHSGSIGPLPHQPRPPISVSVKTKSKLQQFQFQRTVEVPTENTGADQLASKPDSSKESKASSDLTPTNASVETPASRLAWQDLMGAEDAEKQHKDASPDERLQWHIEQDQMAADTSPLVPRRGKKRARSSSPISSPAIEKMRTPPVNVKRLKQAMNSSRADPALDLWDRFAEGAPDSKNPLGATNPALAHLMMSSSPRPSKEAVTAHGEGALRRAISCGSHWPKRRRVESIAEADPAKDRGQTSKSSMVTALLETVNGEINKSNEMEKEQFGMESPSFKKRRSPMKLGTSPTPIVAQQFSGSSIKNAEIKPEQARGLKKAETPPSDYGDDDFDDDTIWELDASLLSGQAEADSFTAVESALVTQDVRKAEQSQEDSYDDEFDDVDDDLLAAAAEDLLAEVPPLPDFKSGSTTTSKAVYLDGGTDDPEDTYEDDFGVDFNFEAAELAATQSVDKKVSSLMPVRTV